ncbi:hypothetical protein ACQ4P5_16115, partial [Ralstonia sp. L16]|uniref:hypothetical protein n=1 Tax=Ralstonia sp. L16 TaxID=3423950 RepID=UPI003F7B0617
MLKNFAINFVYRVAALSAAEKRDYAELFRRCQQLVEEFLSVNSLPTTTRSTANRQPHNRPQTRSAHCLLHYHPALHTGLSQYALRCQVLQRG